MATARSWLPSLNVQSTLASVRSTIKYSIISQQTYIWCLRICGHNIYWLIVFFIYIFGPSEETFGKIAALAAQFFADVKVGYSELILGLMMLSSTAWRSFWHRPKILFMVPSLQYVSASCGRPYERRYPSLVYVVPSLFLNITPMFTNIISLYLLGCTWRWLLLHALCCSSIRMAVDIWIQFWGSYKLLEPILPVRPALTYISQGKANGFVKGLVSGDSINPQIVAAKTGIKEEDLITTQWDSQDFNPGHYMAYDHSRKNVVIAIRGTFHLRDALTDLVASYEPFEDGYAHW